MSGKAKSAKIFDQVFARPLPVNPGDPAFGFGVNQFIGQDSGDVYAVLSLGYNFDGAQSPLVSRLGDEAATAVLLTVPNFYGAHGYDPQHKEMSAIFFAAGPDVCRHEVEKVRNIDIAPTILDILNVRPADTVQGRSLRLCGKGHDDHDSNAGN
jgi:predicted AlkP superfamily pyrophosphatase or phosphodiesterase